MTSKSEFVPFDITVCGIDELVGHATAGVSHVLSILDPDFPKPQAFGTYPAHAKLELRFHDIIKERPGEIAPSRADVDLVLAFGRDLMAAPPAARHLLVHCHMGISRSTAAMLMLLAQARPDVPADTLMNEVLRVRHRAWPNLMMVRYGDDLLGRRGTLVAATKAHYKARATQHPELIAFFRNAGREEEVADL